MQIQAGDTDAFADLYLRYFDRVYAYLKVALRDEHEAEDATQEVFVRVLRALPRYEHRGKPFRAFLFTVARNQSISQLCRRNEVALCEPAEMSRREEARADADDALGWISDPELLLFIERLPPSQQQVLMLRYMLDLSYDDIAAVLDRTSADVRMLQHRALRFLRARLAAVGHAPPPRARSRVRRIFEGRARRPRRVRAARSERLRTK